jgi:hypothetical protein
MNGRDCSLTSALCLQTRGVEEVLIALLVGWLFLKGDGGGDLWFLGGRTPRQVSADVAKVVPDKELQNTTNYNLALIEKEFKSLQSERMSLEKDVLGAMERHDTPAEQFRTFEARADEINTSATKNILDLSFLMREQLSDAQWRALFPAPTAAPSAERR